MNRIRPYKPTRVTSMLMSKEQNLLAEILKAIVDEARAGVKLERHIGIIFSHKFKRHIVNTVCRSNDIYASSIDIDMPKFDL